ncbi:hypothetical protein EYF80_068234 [Liparis tanakae]|uniref:Uncharacterized protein n=1 Tax=Liparis tanakae TaxID=230148 RepID=A0A4Z2DYK7_9TELE|nr:hypothetical protein EYF80_068234 [Liparis tanakae]
MFFSGFLTSSRGLVLRRQDNEAEALVVSALQGDVEALGPRGRRRLDGVRSRLDGVRSLGVRRLGGAVDQGGRHRLGLLSALLLLAI